ncbi:hypothetical protein EDC01DRAFT_74640 [Geopyxis carbonaria]|nr:hypothetical protein EDC01DRAFT_74640 [Geopyxis carbonaria]
MTSMPLTDSSESTLDFTSTDSTPSPSSSLRRPHLPFHLQHNEPQRQPGQYPMPVSSHPENVRQPVAVSVDQQQMYTRMRTLTWDNYIWLFDDNPSDAEVITMNHNQDPALAYIHPLEASHCRSAGLLYDPSNNMKGATPVFHPLDDYMVTQVAVLLRDASLHPGYVSGASMQRYLLNYWTKFHPIFPILHRPTFFPAIRPPSMRISMRMAMLVTIVLAIGASYEDNEACNFGWAAHEKVKGFIMNSEDFSPNSINNLYSQQMILLTDIYGKLRSQRTQSDGPQLDLVLLNIMGQSQALLRDPLETIRRCQNGGLEFNYETEWQTWIELESRKSV